MNRLIKYILINFGILLTSCAGGQFTFIKSVQYPTGEVYVYQEPPGIIYHYHSIPYYYPNYWPHYFHPWHRYQIP